MATSKEIVKPATTNQMVPAFMQGDKGRGYENVGHGDIEIPRIKLIQDMSDEAKNGNVKPGNFWHALYEEDLGNALKIVPVYLAKAHILWRPRKDGGGILARADDGKTWEPADAVFKVKLDGKKEVTWTTKKTVAASGLDRWGSSDPDDVNSQPAATEMWNVLVVLPEKPEIGPAVVSMQRTGMKAAKKLNGMLSLNQEIASFGRYFTMGSIPEKSNLGSYWNFKFTPAGLVESEAEYVKYRALYESFKSIGIKVKDEDQDAGDPQADSTMAEKM